MNKITAVEPILNRKLAYGERRTGESGQVDSPALPICIKLGWFFSCRVLP